MICIAEHAPRGGGLPGKVKTSKDSDMHREIQNLKLKSEGGYALKATFESQRQRAAAIFAIVALCFTVPALPQTGRPPIQTSGGAPALPPGMTRDAKPPQPAPDTPWQTKAELLDAARSGEFRGLPDIRVNAAAQTAPLTNSVIHVLRTEYGVPTLATGKTAGSMDCRSQASEEVRRLLTAVTALHVATLSDMPPTFYRDVPAQPLEQNIKMSLRGLGSGDGLCSTKVMGAERPHPYGAALLQLADEFGAATKEYVQTQRATLKAAYEADLRAKAEAEAKRQAEADAATQAKIDAERARIEQQQQKQKQQQQGRIAG
jgi:hypothetical protein